MQSCVRSMRATNCAKSPRGEFEVFTHIFACKQKSNVKKVYILCKTRQQRSKQPPPSARIAHSPSIDRWCFTVTASMLCDRFGIASHTGSMSGPSISPAPSQPQHHTVVHSQRWFVISKHSRSPCEGPGTNSISSVSSSVKSLSCGPNHDRS